MRANNTISVVVNMKKLMKTGQGFTLIEILLVLVIVGGILGMMLQFTTQRTAQLRRDKTAMDMQLIMNAALSYYVSHGYWPFVGSTHAKTKISATDLITGGYLPSGFGASPYIGASSECSGTNYCISDDSTTAADAFRVFAPVHSSLTNGTVGEASIIAGQVPGGYVATSGTYTYAAAMITIPGQNLNNARSVNYANIYSSGGCVPAPVCPGTMVPQIYLAPASVTGNLDGNGNPLTPLTSYTAFARGNGTTNNPMSCDGTNATASCSISPNPDPSATNYWRACLSVTTSNGTITNGDNTTGKILALTRCVPASESPLGSPIGVYAN